MIVLVALGWAVIAGGAVIGVDRRIEIARRARAMSTRTRPRRWHRVHDRLVQVPAVATPHRVLRSLLRHRRRRRDTDALRSALPISVDLLGVSVGSGATPFRAVQLAAAWSPPPLGDVLDDVVRATAVGSSFDDALRVAGERHDSVRALTETLRTSARLGSPAAVALARLADEVRADVRRHAEARARTVPVRLLFPLVFCVLPAFVLLTVVPVLLDGIRF